MSNIPNFNTKAECLAYNLKEKERNEKEVREFRKNNPNPLLWPIPTPLSQDKPLTEEEYIFFEEKVIYFKTYLKNHLFYAKYTPDEFGTIKYRVILEALMIEEWEDKNYLEVKKLYDEWLRN